MACEPEARWPVAGGGARLGEREPPEGRFRRIVLKRVPAGTLEVYGESSMPNTGVTYLEKVRLLPASLRDASLIHIHAIDFRWFSVATLPSPPATGQRASGSGSQDDFGAVH